MTALTKAELARVLDDLVVDPESGCWLRASAPRPRSWYSYIGPPLQPLHRAAYELWVGPIPAGHELDHVAARGCRFRGCFCPDHLEPVSRPENARRAWRSHPVKPRAQQEYRVTVGRRTLIL